jgi:hypothetical protein
MYLVDSPKSSDMVDMTYVIAQSVVGIYFVNVAFALSIHKWKFGSRCIHVAGCCFSRLVFNHC